FHFGYNETILFSSWTISSVGGLIGSMVAIFLMATLYEGLKYYREYLFWKTYNLLEYRPVPTMISWNHLYQTLLHIFQVTLSFLLMLIFMTYNVWLCLAVVLGAAVGYFLFCWKKSVIVDVTEHCH
uniref:Copper transport protein n=1 Tax=Megaselia scalaris TaxID=36166 RepID=T1H6C0_MEGSC